MKYVRHLVLPAHRPAVHGIIRALFSNEYSLVEATDYVCAIIKASNVAYNLYLAEPKQQLIELYT